ncbi:hypothetical protein BN8_03439 [Fibrisoma limi BUZ 3]|uniref:Uncharacterized protein n=1 Tax=Fibrisoma limi BUZ 3 TaxID=1185876 RepID=I2GK56_9BACT|nr:hypothetical protein [Fibrisoma limi]CCH54281.1 hypothetical protein BN8_03439 [Fibrisoma limi BUZ 3]
MKKNLIFVSVQLLALALTLSTLAQPNLPKRATPLLKADLSNALDEKKVWRFEDGILTASADEQLWTKQQYENFVLELDFKMKKRPTVACLYMPAI